MSRLRLNKIAAPSAPASGKAELYLSNETQGFLRFIDQAGHNTAIGGYGLSNYSVVLQTPSATTRTYVTGSQIIVPNTLLQIGSTFVWTFNMTKTAAGTAASTIDIAIGTAGTTADSAIASFTKPAGTAVADEAFCEVVAIVRGPLTASCIMSGEFFMAHNLAATGHAQIPCVVVNTISGAFNATTAGLFLGLCITTGASDAITIQQVTTQAWNI